MCGRYFWKDEAEDAFLEDFPDLAGVVRRLRAGDYTPGMSATSVRSFFCGDFRDLTKANSSSMLGRRV